MSLVYNHVNSWKESFEMLEDTNICKANKQINVRETIEMFIMRITKISEDWSEEQIPR